MRFPQCVLAGVVLLGISAHATEAPAVLAAPRERVQSADFRASGHLVRVNGDGTRISVPITIKAHWFPGVLRVLVEVGAAAKTGASLSTSEHIPIHILLEMRPNGQNVVEIVHPGDKAPVILPFEKWSDGPLGAGFSYEDFLEPQYFWPGQAVLETTLRGSRKCEVVKSTPGAADKTHYAEIRTWLDQTIGFPVYAEKTMKGTGALKEFTYLGIRHNGGVWSATQVEAKVRGKDGSTLLIIDRGSAKANLGLKDFSTAQISHFQDGP
jgi:hypothetical protein